LYKRLIKLRNSSSFFLFGQRGTGKSTLLATEFAATALTLSLLDSKLFLKLSRAPWELKELVLARKKEQSLVILDEIQKIPILLDEVHRLIEEDKIVFVLTGSSARKLKQAGVNLLAGRAATYKLYPLTCSELGESFDLLSTLQWGSLPSVANTSSLELREDYLYAYVDTYLKEEIILEQVVRQIEPFSRFLEVAAQSHGEVISFANIARDVGISAVSVKNYFDILVDTLIGFFLPSYHKSVRKKQKQAPKFYFYDNGIVRTIKRQVALPLHTESIEFGRLFESFFINEIIRLDEYARSRFAFSHLRIDEKDEIDLIIERPGRETLLVEIKSSNAIRANHVEVLNRLGATFRNAKLYCFSQDPQRQKLGNVLCLPWREGLDEIFK
jgi:predicted AAA+ superfamily ATPase